MLLCTGSDEKVTNMVSASEIIEADYLPLKYFSAIANQGIGHFFYILCNKYLLNIYSVQGTMPSTTEY